MPFSHSPVADRSARVPNMRSCWMFPIVLLAGSAAVGQGRVDPERILAERFAFSSADVAKARQGQPAVKVQGNQDELAVVGAIRLAGKKERLADWLKNVEHFRKAAELGTAHVVPAPPTGTAFAAATLDGSDLAELKHCGTGKCALRLSADALAKLQRDVHWDTPGAAAQAD